MRFFGVDATVAPITIRSAGVIGLVSPAIARFSPRQKKTRRPTFEAKGRGIQGKSRARLI